jgi:alpha-tubulin suppressor-like RCC1 family protein
VKQLALNDDSSCAVLEKGQVVCWGKNWFLPDVAGRSLQQPTSVPGLSGITQVVLSEFDEYGCALQSSGEVLCWGRNLLKASLEDTYRAPAPLPGLSGVVGIALGQRHALAWTTSGELFRWSSDLRDPVTRVEGVGPVASAETTGAHACALLRSGEVRCFLPETLGALKAGKQHDLGPKMRKVAQAILRATNGKGVTFSRSKHPWGGTLFPDGRGLKDVRQLLVSQLDASALTLGGEVFGWGNAQRGTIGRHEDSRGLWPPARIEGFSGVTALAGGSRHRCALLRDETVTCLGSGLFLGQGERQASSVAPRLVPSLNRIQSIVASEHCTFALDADHAVWAWGDNWTHACGTGGGDHPEKLEFEAGDP